MFEISEELLKLIQAKSFFAINRFCVYESELCYSNGLSSDFIKHHFTPFELVYLQSCSLRYSRKDSVQNKLSVKY